MSQSFTSTLAGSAVSFASAVRELLIANDLALLSLHSGSSEPAYTVAGMLWLDTGNGLLKIRNSGNSAWHVLAVYGQDLRAQRVCIGEALSLSAARSWHWYAPQDVTVSRLVLVTDTATTSSSGNEWTVELANLTQTEDLFSATVGSYQTDGSIGGGEFAADTVEPFVPDQNAAVDADDVLEVTLTPAGSATTLGRVSVWVEFLAR